MSTHYIVENGVLIQKLFVGPIQEAIKEKKFKIAERDERLDNVNEVLVENRHLLEQQALASKALDTGEIEPVQTERHKKKIIRRRRKFVYHAADEVINKGYWKREKRSLTKFHSNSLMYEYHLVQAGYKENK